MVKSQPNQREPSPTYDIFLSHGEREAAMAARLRGDLPRANLSVHPSSTFSRQVLGQCRVVIALQAARKPDEAVQAAVAVAQSEAYDYPILTVYIDGETLSLRRSSQALLYDSYEQGVLQLVLAIWAALDDPRGQMVIDQLPETDEAPLALLDRLARQQNRDLQSE